MTKINNMLLINDELILVSARNVYVFLNGAYAYNQMQTWSKTYNDRTECFYMAKAIKTKGSVWSCPRYRISVKFRYNTDTKVTHTRTIGTESLRARYAINSEEGRRLLLEACI